jgi:hypothetical protein
MFATSSLEFQNKAKTWRSQQLVLPLLRFFRRDEFIAAADEFFYFFPVDGWVERQRDPAMVADVGSFGEAGIFEKKGLGFLFYFDADVVVVEDGKGFIAPFEEGMADKSYEFGLVD